MDENSIFVILERRLHEYKSSIEQFLATGGAKDQDAYWHAVGEYSSYNKILDDLKEIEKRYIDS
jgi:hypothetical protein